MPGSNANLLGSKESIIEAFAIEGLYGYRSVSLSSPYAATIMIAKNGSGKSTLLGALDAFLKCQFFRLQDLDFKKIRCKLRGLEQELELEKSDIDILSVVPVDSEIARHSRAAEVDVQTLRRFIAEVFPFLKGDYDSLSEDKVFTAIWKSVGYNYPDAVAVCDRLSRNLYLGSERLTRIQDLLATALDGAEIVYLPTFRRVELPLQSDRGKQPKAQLKFSPSSSLYGGNIQFGLSDIHERLAELNRTILSDSNIGYRKISANIINELIDGTFERDDFASNNLPDRESLELFFSRLKEGGKRIGPYPHVAIPNIEKIYGSDDLDFVSRKTLRYFLGKLYTVINSTRDIELRVEEFISVCNKYLNGEDDSAKAPSDDCSRGKKNADSKVLRLNRRNLSVHAESPVAGKKIPLDSLSSGEKQMVSLFAKLYLYQKNKIILIDEPELSMSLSWQRQILPDVITAPLCKQVIAITHSPFIFDNELEPYAKSLTMKLELDSLEPSGFDDDENA